jgi:DNA-directed RNA polymerase subunit RPC12/RpoP
MILKIKEIKILKIKMALLDLKNKKFGRLFVIDFAGIKNEHSYWNCRCDCGIEKEIRGNLLTFGSIISCGCAFTDFIENKAKLNKGNIFKTGPKKTNEEFINDLIKIHGNKYDYSKVKYTGSRNKIIMICPKEGHGEFSQTAAHHLQGSNCPKCAKDSNKRGKNFKKKYSNEIIDEFLKKENSYIIRLTDYVEKLKLEWKCLLCNNTWKSHANAILYCKKSCPYCKDLTENNKKIDNFLLEHNNLVQRLDNYINNYIKMQWKCLNCNNIWVASASGIINKKRLTGCPHCSSRKNEKIVGEILQKLGFTFIKNKPLFINGKKYLPDYYIPLLNLYIEYNGQQHYSPVKFGGMSEEQAKIALNKQIIRDNNFRKYCLENDLFLFEIDGRSFRNNDLRDYILNHFVSRIFGQFESKD